MITEAKNDFQWSIQKFYKFLRFTTDNRLSRIGFTSPRFMRGFLVCY